MFDNYVFLITVLDKKQNKKQISQISPKLFVRIIDYNFARLIGQQYPWKPSWGHPGPGLECLVLLTILSYCQSTILRPLACLSVIKIPESDKITGNFSPRARNRNFPFAEIHLMPIKACARRQYEEPHFFNTKLKCSFHSDYNKMRCYSPHYLKARLLAPLD